MSTATLSPVIDEAAARRARGDVAGTLEALWERVREAPYNAENWATLSETFAQVEFSPEADVSLAYEWLALLLRREGVDPQSLGRATSRLLRRHPDLAPGILAADRLDEAGVARIIQMPAVEEVLRSNLVSTIWETMVVPDIGVERFWRAVRAKWLEDVSSGRCGDSDAVISLARQCALNGYIWSYGEREQDLVEEGVLARADRQLGPADLPWIGMIACYVPLLGWDRLEEVVDLADSANSPALVGLVTEQVLEPVREATWAKGLPALTEVADEVSTRVQEQYEDHPYPRWKSVAFSAPKPLVKVLDRVGSGVLPECRSQVEAITNPRILVAGCGTGRQLVQALQTYQGAQVVGVDLSRASLGYAFRKLQEMGRDDVALAQADLLELGEWKARFDVIECMGVLHHLADPVAGWETLTRLLEPGGYMRVGLYSDLARSSVARLRERFRGKSVLDWEDLIRSTRRQIAEAASGEYADVLEWDDFYSMQECRDLLFHEHEDPYTIPRLEAEIGALGLEFMGFEIRDPAIRQATSHFRRAEEGTELEAWDRFERANPRTFAGMYQFWVRKPHSA